MKVYRYSALVLSICLSQGIAVASAYQDPSQSPYEIAELVQDSKPAASSASSASVSSAYTIPGAAASSAAVSSASSSSLPAAASLSSSSSSSGSVGSNYIPVPVASGSSLALPAAAPVRSAYCDKTEELPSSLQPSAAIPSLSSPSFSSSSTPGGESSNFPSESRGRQKSMKAKGSAGGSAGLSRSVLIAGSKKTQKPRRSSLSASVVGKSSGEDDSHTPYGSPELASSGYSWTPPAVFPNPDSSWSSPSHAPVVSSYLAADSALASSEILRGGMSHKLGAIPKAAGKPCVSVFITNKVNGSDAGVAEHYAVPIASIATPAALRNYLMRAAHVESLDMRLVEVMVFTPANDAFPASTVKGDSQELHGLLKDQYELLVHLNIS